MAAAVMALMATTTIAHRECPSFLSTLSTLNAPATVATPQPSHRCLLGLGWACRALQRVQHAKLNIGQAMPDSAAGMPDPSSSSYLLLLWSWPMGWNTLIKHIQ